MARGGYEKPKYQKNSPEMNVSEGDLFPVNFLSKSVEKQKSYSNFHLQEIFLEIFDVFAHIWDHLRSDNDVDRFHYARGNGTKKHRILLRLILWQARRHLDLKKKP